MMSMLGVGVDPVSIAERSYGAGGGGHSDLLPGLPTHFALGVQSRGAGTGDLSWMQTSGVSWDFRYAYMAQASGWSPPNQGGVYVSDGLNNNYIPVITYYTAPSPFSNLQNTTFMNTYYTDFVTALNSMAGWKGWYLSRSGSTLNTIASDGSTVTHTSATNSDCQATAGLTHKTGKWVYRIHINAIGGSGHTLVGFSNPASLAFDDYLGESTSSAGLSSTGLFINNTVVNAQPALTPTAGHDIDVAIDLDNQLVWMSDNSGNWNGSSSNNPATNVGGVFYGAGGANGANGFATGVPIAPAVSTYWQTDQFSFGTPRTVSGFAAWNSSPANPAMILHIEPDLWGYMQAGSVGGTQTDDPTTVPISVASSGYAGVSGYPNTAAGFAQALKHLRDINAPGVYLAYHASTWGPQDGFIATNSSFNEPPATTGARMANFYGGLKTAFDIIFHDTTTADRDSDYGILVNSASLPATAAVWWWTAAAFENFRQLLGAFHANVSPKGIWWQVPEGNTLFQSCNDTSYHYQDNKAEFFLKTASQQGVLYDANGISHYAVAGIIGLLFGPGQTLDASNYDYAGDGITNPGAITNQNGWSGNTATATVSDDDGGFLRAAAAAYYTNPVMVF